MADAPRTLFISYAHTDSPFVDRLEADLRQQGFATWVDRQRLAAGQRWRRELQEAVEDAQVLLIVLSPESVASNNVQIEYDYALDQGKIVIPLFYRQCNVPMELRAIQWIDFRKDYEPGLQVLLQVLLQRPEPAPAIPASTAAPPPAPSLASEADQSLRRPSQKLHGETGLLPPLPPTNLPAQLTPLIGRQQELEAVCTLLRQTDLRLVTLTGMAGIGKTRLALKVAADLSEQFPDGVFLVALAPVSDPQQVVPTIQQALSISDISGQTPLQRIKTTISQKHLLLILDNFEQVIEAAVIVAELLAACPGLKVLVTSRVVLHLRGEHEVDVPSLRVPNPKRLPDLAHLVQYEAVALFLARAQAVKSDFELTAANAAAVVGICTKLDGLPLAIELAAARSKYFPPHNLLSRLEQGLSVLSGGARDLPVRQQTLRGALAWSYELLQAEEQQLFRRCSIFVDGCTWQAAEHVCTAAGLLQIDILEGLLSLVDKSLLRQEASDPGIEEAEPRFAMLQTLREYGLEMLASTAETRVTRQAHADYYLALVQEAEPHLRGAEQANWLARLEQEHENLRAACSWLLEQAHLAVGSQEAQQQIEHTLRLGIALNWFWMIRGYPREGLAFLQQALAAPENVATVLKAKALYVAAEMAFYLDDLKQTENLCTECLTLFRELEDKAGMGDSLLLLGTVAWARSAYALARPQLEEAVAFYQELGEHWKRGRCLTQLARIDTAQGEYDQAQGLLEECLTIYQTLGDKVRLGWVLYLHARLLYLSKSDLAQASNLTEQSLALHQEGDTVRDYPLILLGQLNLQQGEPERARELFEEGLASCKETGDTGGTFDALMGLASIAMQCGNLAEARTLYQESLIIAQETEYKEGAAPALEGLAAAKAQQSEFEQAARLWGAAETLRETIGAPIPPIERVGYEQAVTAARSQGSAEAFGTAWAEGRTTSLVQVVAEVLKPAS